MNNGCIRPAKVGVDSSSHRYGVRAHFGGPHKKNLRRTSMRSFKILSLAAVSALAFAPTAFAQDVDTASGKRFAVVGSATLLEPHSKPANGLDIDGGPAPTISASWLINDNWALELW